MENEVEKKIIEWLKSDNENVTYLAHQICDLFSVVVRSESLKCPECLKPVDQQELDMLGGLCEECSAF